MELVYLWVEDYKNIKKQGFNFSPRFRCEYDKDSNELTIKKNEDYIPDFFGENINVTAIVGKNGSGKSSLLEYMSDAPKILLYFQNNELFINQNIKVNNLTKYQFIYKKIKSNFQYIVSSDYFLNNFDKLSFSESFNKTNLEYMKLEDGLADGSYLENIFRQLNFFHNTKNNINEIVSPKNIIIEVYPDEDIYDIFKVYKTIHDKEISLSEIVYFMAYHFMLRQNEHSSDFYALLENYFNYNLNKIEKDYSLEELFIKFEEKVKLTPFYCKYKQVLTYCKLFSSYSDITAVSQAGMFIFYIPMSNFRGELLNKNFFNQENWFHFSFKWDINFSSGESGIIHLLTTLFYTLQLNKTQIIFVDEGETFLHPNWQKKYLSYIVQFLKDNFPDRKLHVVLTTHSPFLLSDIPKQNIIFLDKDEQGNCKVVDGLNDKKQTFGANIHTLLSDSFFMEGGLMGEFAKKKIDKVITILNQEKPNKKDLKYCEKIIPIIGEPIVKNQLQKMLDSKKLPKVGEIDKIHKEIEALQSRLKNLEVKDDKK